MATSMDGNVSGEGGDRPSVELVDESAKANETSTPGLMSSGDEKSEERKATSVNEGEEGSTSPLLSEEEDEKGVNELEREQAEDGGYAGDVDGTLSRSRHLADVNGTTVEEDDGEDARNDLNSSGDESGGSSEWSSGAEWEDENGDFNDDSGDELGLKSSSKGKKAKKKKKVMIVSTRCLWVQLSRCRIGDKKVKRLSDALRGNTTVTSIDLSDNKITDDGIKVLAGVLAGGSASDLISLDVRGNHLSSAGLAALRSLQGLRKLVKVEYGESMSRKYEDGPENGNGDLSTGGGKENRANGWVDDAHERLLASSAEDWTEETVREGLPRAVPSLNEWAAVEQVESAMKAVAESAECLNVGHLTAQITNVLHMIDQELREAPTRSILLDKLPRGLALTTANIEKFVSVLDMSPPPRLMQNKEVMPTAGRHRIVVIELLSRLVMYCSQEIDQKIVLTGAVRKVVDLMFSHPLCSILHGQASHFLEGVLTRPNSSLCSHVLEGAEGLPTQLAKAGRECAAMRIGKRPGYCGHVVVLCRTLENVADINSNVRGILEKNEDWLRFTAPGGALGKLVKEQFGGLGGPKPQFPMSCLFDGGSAQAAVDHLRALFLG
ncbi:hypothetical protein CBR_g38425 [Chara braunii]|uniref:Uncharacterized protein n=1 Tax=Chara braunii TaxID=69332 RepID=A0A388JNJ9_CHABU|nr:hypothetical protein CBR_g38425 [Chara braunii]|eukprot:GBG59399.1 hypothetical protein CBR_g38425 [Chara braunii]